jgi:hypothetical protein
LINGAATARPATATNSTRTDRIAFPRNAIPYLH